MPKVNLGEISKKLDELTIWVQNMNDWFSKDIESLKRCKAELPEIKSVYNSNFAHECNFFPDSLKDGHIRVCVGQMAAVVFIIFCRVFKQTNI